MLIDLSHQLENGVLPFPGDPDFSLVQIAAVKEKGYSNYLLQCGMHIGTHVDGVGHIVDSNHLISQMPLDLFCGEAIFLNYKHCSVIDYTSALDDLLVDGKIVLIYTGHSKKWGSEAYFAAHPIITQPFSTWLIAKGVKMVAIDFPSPDVEPYLVHKVLLGNGIPILENLTNLERLIGAKTLTIMAFPLKLSADSSPVRAVAEVGF